MKKINEERILQISNDFSEGIESGTKEEWKQVAIYFRNKYDEANEKLCEMALDTLIRTCEEELAKFKDS